MREGLHNIRVVELSLNRGGEKTKNSIKRLTNLVQPIHSVSCIRHIFIFFDVEEHDHLTEILDELKSKNKACQLLVGSEAYSFLLSWIIGGEYRVQQKSKVSLYNDNHVLGKFKKNWAFFLSTQEDKQLIRKYTDLVSQILEAAHEIRKRIEQGVYGEREQLRNNLDRVIANICFSRIHALPVAYDQMNENRKKYTLAVLLLVFKKIRIISNVLKQYEQKISDQFVHTTVNDTLSIGLFRKHRACFKEQEQLKDKINAVLEHGLLKFCSNKTNRQIHLFFKEEGLFNNNEAFRKKSFQKACEESRAEYKEFLLSEYSKTTPG